MTTDRLLVPVANPETADRLVNTAADIALDRDLGLLVLTVVEVPMQVPLEAARERLEVDAAEAVVSHGVDRAIERGVGVTARVRFGRDVVTSIRAVAAEDDVAACLLGWRGRPRRRDIVLGSYIDDLLGTVQCDVIVERIDRDAGSIDSILVPVAGGPNTPAAAAVAGSIARTNDATVELLSVVADDDSVETGREVLEDVTGAVGPVRSVTQTVHAGPTVATILDHANEHDVTIVGAAGGGLIRRRLVGEIPERIARDAAGTVLMVQPQHGRPRAFLRRTVDRVLAVLA